MSLKSAFQTPNTRYLLLTGFFAFILIGAIQAMYGPSFPAFQERYGLSAERVGLVVSAHFFGSFTTIALSGLLIRLLGYRWLLAVSALVMAGGALGVALSPSWTLTLLAAFSGGLGFGALDVGVNLLFARSFEEGSAPVLNVLHALFGVGAILGPVLVSLFLPAFMTAFLILAVCTGLLFFLCLRLQSPPPLEAPDAQYALPYGRLTGFVLIYFLYVTAEVGVASWESTHLAPAFGVEAAARFNALYWAALTLGRFVASPISSRVQPGTLVTGSLCLALGAILLTPIMPIAPYAYALVGFAFAPFFPTGISWLQQVFPKRAEQLTPIVIAVANLGPVIGSSLIGSFVERGSSASIPYILAAVIACLLVLTSLLWIKTRGAQT